jgi:murein DD-endopeptidase MepM/ murein hydrolase activator NlpD
MEKDKQKLIKRLKNRYRLVIINDATFDEKFSFSLTPLNLFVGFSSFLVFFAGIIVLMIVFTPLKEFIPGYTDTSTKNNISRLLQKTDSLESVLVNRDEYYKNILKIVKNEDLETIEAQKDLPKVVEKSVIKKSNSKIVDEFMKDFENQKDEYNVTSKKSKNKQSGQLTLYKPVNGVVSKPFQVHEHPAIDIVTKPNEAVRSVMDGRVILATWTSETGYVIAIQHRNNAISIYKHNASILKKYGTFVRAGEPIAIVGNSGEQTTGPHLHFEWWENGNAINPENMFNFN